MKVIQVGIGGMGRVWLETVFASDEIEFAGFVEVNPAVVDAQVERYGLDRALIFPTLGDALAAVSAEGVINVTPPQFHRDVSITALEAGIPVLSEKPLAPTLEDAQAIVDAANQTGVLHMVAQNYRYSVPAQTLKNVLVSGRMGEIGGVSVQFFKGPHFGGFREEMDYPLIVDMSIHHFDLMRFFLDCDPTLLFGRSWNPTWSWFRGDASASVLIHFVGGITAAYTGSWCANGRETTWNGDWRFDCENGVVTLLDDQVMIYGAGGAPPERVEPMALPYTAQAYLLREFHTAVLDGIHPITTCQDNINSLRMVLGLVDSFQSGGVIRL